jgi:5-methylthioadenosine/S-adenosylhomocysteine deaminase
MVWSPFSNFWLYGSTADIAAAKKQGVSICIGSDWGPSGSKNVQGELKVAKLASKKLGLGFTDRELVATVTSNPGDALSRCWKKVVGRLQEGSFGDVTVFSASSKAVWTHVVESTEADVRLVVYDGVPRYGDAALMNAAPIRPSSPITVRAKKYRFAISDPAAPTKAWSFADITGALDAVSKDPVTALKKADGERRAFAGPIDADNAPLELVLDMPFGGTPIAGDISDHAAEIVIPKLPTLVHDAAFFKSIKGRGLCCPSLECGTHPRIHRPK